MITTVSIINLTSYSYFFSEENFKICPLKNFQIYNNHYAVHYILKVYLFYSWKFVLLTYFHQFHSHLHHHLC